MDPYWLFADQDPENLMNVNPDPDPGQWNRQMDFNPSFESLEGKNGFKNCT